MTRDELNAQIIELESAADGLEEPDKTFKLNELSILKIQLEGMALSDITAKLDNIHLPDVKEIEQKIADAKQATADHQTRVDALDSAFEKIKTVLRIK